MNTNNGQSAAEIEAAMMDGQTPIPDELLKQVAGALKGLVNDTTNPEFLNHVRVLLSDHAAVLRLRLAGADAGLLARAETSLRARQLSILGTPAYAAANRQDELLSIGSRILDALFGYGTSVLNQAITGGLGKLDGVLSKAG